VNVRGIENDVEWMKRKRDHMPQFTERFWRWLAWKLPRKLVYWCTIRLVAHVTSGYWGRTDVPSLTAVEALHRFEKGPGAS